MDKTCDLIVGGIAELGKNKGELRDPQTKTVHYKMIERRYADAFPDDGLAYMIGCSMYGLIDTLLDTEGADR